MRQSEKSILNQTEVALSSLPDTMVWRNNTGQAWQGDEVRKPPGSFVKVEAGMVILRGARRISFGLPGSGDILGVSKGRAIAVEVKAERGRQSDQQYRFERAFEKCRGIYVLGDSATEICAILTRRTAP